MNIDFDRQVLSAQSPEARLSTLPVVTEDVLVSTTDQPGLTLFRGRYWRTPEDSRGLLHVPLTIMATMTKGEFGYPRHKTLGIIARVEDMPANAAMRVHTMSDLSSFNPLERLEGSARRNIRAAIKKGVRIERITPRDMTFLEEKGYEAWISSAASTGHPRTRQGFELHVQKIVAEDALVLAAVVNGDVVGYTAGEVMQGEKNAYLRRMVLSRDPELSEYNAGSLLTYAFVQACLRTPEAEQVIHSRERNSGLTQYKIKMGFPLVEIPLVAKLRPPMALALEIARKLKPELYYKVYGRY